MRFVSCREPPVPVPEPAQHQEPAPETIVVLSVDPAQPQQEETVTELLPEIASGLKEMVIRANQQDECIQQACGEDIDWSFHEEPWSTTRVGVRFGDDFTNAMEEAWIGPRPDSDWEDQEPPVPAPVPEPAQQQEPVPPCDECGGTREVGLIDVVDGRPPFWCCELRDTDGANCSGWADNHVFNEITGRHEIQQQDPEPEPPVPAQSPPPPQHFVFVC